MGIFLRNILPMAFILVSNHLNMMNFRAIFWGPNVDMSFVFEFEVVQPQEQCILAGYPI